MCIYINIYMYIYIYIYIYVHVNVRAAADWPTRLAHRDGAAASQRTTVVFFVFSFVFSRFFSNETDTTRSKRTTAVFLSHLFL